MTHDSESDVEVEIMTGEYANAGGMEGGVESEKVSPVNEKK